MVLEVGVLHSGQNKGHELPKLIFVVGWLILDVGTEHDFAQQSHAAGVDFVVFLYLLLCDKTLQEGSGVWQQFDDLAVHLRVVVRHQVGHYGYDDAHRVRQVHALARV